jgi:hypothetical protein
MRRGVESDTNLEIRPLKDGGNFENWRFDSVIWAAFSG